MCMHSRTSQRLAPECSTTASRTARKTIMDYRQSKSEVLTTIADCIDYVGRIFAVLDVEPRQSSSTATKRAQVKSALFGSTREVARSKQLPSPARTKQQSSPADHQKQHQHRPHLHRRRRSATYFATLCRTDVIGRGLLLKT